MIKSEDYFISNKGLWINSPSLCYITVAFEEGAEVNCFDILERFPGGDIVDQNNCLGLSNEVSLESGIASYDIDIMELDENILIVSCQVSPLDVVWRINGVEESICDELGDDQKWQLQNSQSHSAIASLSWEHPYKDTSLIPIK